MRVRAETERAERSTPAARALRCARRSRFVMVARGRVDFVPLSFKPRKLSGRTSVARPPLRGTVQPSRHLYVCGGSSAKLSSRSAVLESTASAAKAGQNLPRSVARVARFADHTVANGGAGMLLQHAVRQGLTSTPFSVAHSAAHCQRELDLTAAAETASHWPTKHFAAKARPALRSRA